MTYTLHHGDSLHILAELPDNSVDAVVTDPPYGLGEEPDALAMLQDWIGEGHHDVKGKGFMGKSWDAFVPQPALWREALRVLKPGGYMLAFGGSRTYDLVVLGLRIAGFEIRDCVMWIYGSGFPKSLDISKAIDKAAGAEREVVGINENGVGSWHLQSKVEHRANGGTGIGYADGSGKVFAITAPATEAAQQWDGWGTALKPAHEPIVLARKPLSERNVAANVLRWGTGGVNVDGTRIEGRWEGSTRTNSPDRKQVYGTYAKIVTEQHPNGRFPANVIHDGSDEVLAGFPAAGGGFGKRGGKRSLDYHFGGTMETVGYGDTGSAARFFYAAKASRRERNEGLGDGRNGHPTVKPISLMRYLCRLITPPNGIILDPFTGSGTTGCAAMLEGFRFIGIEREAEYVEIARRRIEHWREDADEKVTDEQPELFEAYA